MAFLLRTFDTVIYCKQCDAIQDNTVCIGKYIFIEVITLSGDGYFDIDTKLSDMQMSL